jgi:hypothetical protein
MEKVYGVTKALPWVLSFILALAATEVSVAAPVTTSLPAVADTTLRQQQANQNRGGDEQVRLGWAQASRALVRFDPGAIAAAVGDGTLLSAHLELEVEETGESWPGGSQNVGAHRVTAAWTGTGATWNCAIDTQPGDNRADCNPQWNGGSFLAAATATVPHTKETRGLVRFDVTADVAAFLAGTANEGWLLKKENETLSGRIDYVAREGVAAERAPRLVVVVEPPSGGDQTPPVITNLTPPAGSFISSTRPTVSASFADEESGVDLESAVFAVDGVDVTSSAVVSAAGIAWGPGEAMEEGVHSLELRVTDGAGNRATATWSFTIDLIPPTLSIVEPAEPVITGNPTPSIVVTYADVLSGVDPSTLEITLDDADITASCAVTATGASCAALPLQHGSHSMTVVVQDRAGQTQVATRTFQLLLDVAPPAVTITTPENGVAVNTSKVVVAGTVTDDVEIASVTVNGQAVSLTAGAFATEVTLDAVVQNITVSAVDGIGQQGSASVVVISDQTPPTVAVASPTSPALVNTEEVHVTGKVEDDNEVAELRVAGEPVGLTDGAFDATVSLEPGTNQIPLVATDLAGNLSQQTLEVEYFTLPVVSIISPEDLSTIAATTVDVSGTVEAPVATVTVNGVAASVSGSSFTAAGVPLIEGGNTLTAAARNAGGHIATDSVTVLRDTRPPVARVYSPRDGGVVFTNTIAVRGLINDIVAGTVNSSEATVTVNGLDAVVQNRSFLVEAVPLALGENTLAIVAVDASGNSATTTMTVVRQAPAATRIERVSGGGQSAAIGALLPEPLVARVVDATGSGIPNVPVVFSVEDSDGTMQAVGGDATTRKVVVPTDASGTAAVRHTLGMRAGVGNQVVVARAAGYAGRAEFAASGLAGEPALIVVDANGLQVGVTGRELPRPLVAAVVDAGSNRLPGVPVRFRVVRGGGHFAGGLTDVVVETDSDGRAIAPFVLGDEEGVANHAVVATIDGLAGSPAAGFSASARAAGDPAATTISGVVLDNTDLPIAGVTARIRDTTMTAVTDHQGQFRIAGAPVGDVDLIIDGSTAARPGSWPDLEFDLVTIPGSDNSVNMPIRLLPLDLARGVRVSETEGGTVTLPEIPGFALEIAPGSVTFPGGGRSGVVSVTVVHSDKVPMTPNFGQAPRLIVTIQPAGALFDPPAPLTLPNVEGFAPGTVTEMYSFDHDLGHFVSIGPATVSEDGTLIRSNPGVGILKAGWHCGGNPGGTGTPHDCPLCRKCEDETCVADDSQSPEQETGNCRGEICHDGSPSSENDDSDIPPNTNPLDCLKRGCKNGKPNWLTDKSEEPRQIEGNCYREKCPLFERELDPSDAPPGLECCIEDDLLFDDVATFNPENQCCTKHGIRAKCPVSKLDLTIGTCPNVRRKDGFNWPAPSDPGGCVTERHPGYDGCTVPLIPDGPGNNPANFDTTSFAFPIPTAPCYQHDACYFDCAPNFTGQFQCNIDFCQNLFDVCLHAEPDARPGCLIMAGLYCTGVTSAGPFVYPGSQQTACQCC